MIILLKNIMQYIINLLNLFDNVEMWKEMEQITNIFLNKICAIDVIIFIMQYTINLFNLFVNVEMCPVPRVNASELDQGCQ